MLIYVRHPETWRLWLPSIVLTVLALIAGVYAAWRLADDAAARLWERPEGWLLLFWYPYLLAVLLLLLSVVVLIVLIFNALITAPFNDRLSRRVEELLTGAPPPDLTLIEGLTDAVKSVGREGTKVIVFLTLWLPVVSLHVIPVAGPPLAGLAAWLITVLFLAYDYIDWSASRRAWSMAQRAAFVRRHWQAALGFGGGAWLLLFVPLVNLFLAPAAVAGGTILFLELNDAVSRDAGSEKQR